MSKITLPSISSQGSLAKYLQDIRKFPMLKLEEEYTLAKSWQEKKDINAAHKLVTSHLRLVAKIALKYRGYGLPIPDLISEGNVGLMQAVKRFDPDKGFRLATYAMWWIKAAIQEYILHSWSLVKIGTTAAQKKLFFNLRKIKNELKLIHDGSLKPDEIKSISEKLEVAEKEVVDMNNRMAGPDHSLNAPLKRDSSSEWQDWLVDGATSQEETLEESQEYKFRKTILMNALSVLNDREKYIFNARRLQEKQSTLDELSKKFDISRERIRQIEVKAFEKVQSSIKQLMKDKNQIKFIERTKN
ncbi:MAG: RNA polymerase sigma factor RpoH [Alphaproteobacteria bacterium MarineAlpha9_Bin4]|nr:RNA polymerase sigma factor RpoH [Pelagibacterales bacterium]PPR26951.1 MAG: RNA polymerase sigma factor RpoH [Alphaproteobacteria bacterium MarineAlpha9_Bin4]|tara:strand:- start:54 stop:956 length:903 start_codon:yes stop_codon:yes gene_type:complete